MRYTQKVWQNREKRYKISQTKGVRVHILPMLSSFHKLINRDKNGKTQRKEERDSDTDVHKMLDNL